MLAQGGDCSIVIKTFHCEKDIPYSSETLREAFFMLYEEPALEGDGMVRAMRKSCGVTGCIVSPLTIGTAPLLLYLAMGLADSLLFVSETRDLYRSRLSLVPMIDAERFNLMQDRGAKRRIYSGCMVEAFELRFIRGEAVKLKLDITGECPSAVYLYKEAFAREQGERFRGDDITYKINGKEYTNIYGLTMASQKENGTKTEVWIRRSLEQGFDIPEVIDELEIRAHLLRDYYEERRYGAFIITLKDLVMIADETDIDSSKAVIGPLRFFVSGSVCADVFKSGDEVFT